jgi:hypothetical protein
MKNALTAITTGIVMLCIVAVIIAITLRIIGWILGGL